jgi:protein-S-isoprenylcysteine O-methyltransferase Ste14
MGPDRLKKIFGVGPLGAAVSLLLLALSAKVDRWLGHPVIADDAALLRAIGIALLLLGLGLHGWAFVTLRHWWREDRLCTGGPFRYFRHPMYAAWITFVSSGGALILNSWVYAGWVILLHPIWHGLVKREEAAMRERFGEAYGNYAGRTGRFLPKLGLRGRP